jgi:putative transcriptional regulator
MGTRDTFKSDVFEAVHSAVAGMHQAGTIDRVTMERFDSVCLKDLGLDEAGESKPLQQRPSEGV